MDKKKEKMTPERRYELACLILGGVVLGGALGCILRPNEWTFAVIPLLGVCLTALLWCAAARLWLCRDKQRLLAKEGISEVLIVAKEHSAYVKIDSKVTNRFEVVQTISQT